MKTELREICYSGHVQGVGFRYTTRDIASRLAVAGYVTNLPDGRVRLVVEGTPSELNLLERSINERMAGNIAGTSRDVRPATGHYDTFEIKY